MPRWSTPHSTVSTQTSDRDLHRIELPLAIRMRGVERRLVIEGQNPSRVRLDHTLIDLVARAHIYLDALAAGREPFRDCSRTRRSSRRRQPSASLGVPVAADRRRHSDRTTAGPSDSATPHPRDRPPDRLEGPGTAARRLADLTGPDGRRARAGRLRLLLLTGQTNRRGNRWRASRVTGTITRPSPFEDSGNRKGASETRGRKAADIADLRRFQPTNSYSPTRKRLNLRR
jgi:hypothetical protein